MLSHYKNNKEEIYKMDRVGEDPLTKIKRDFSYSGGGEFTTLQDILTGDYWGEDF